MDEDDSAVNAGEGNEKEKEEEGGATGGLADLHGKVLNCLIRRRDQITSFAREPGNRRQEARFAQASQCRAHVAEAMKEIASDLRLNPELHEACFDDQKCVCRLRGGEGGGHLSSWLVVVVAVNVSVASGYCMFSTPSVCSFCSQVLLREHKTWHGLSAHLPAGPLESAEA